MSRCTLVIDSRANFLILLHALYDKISLSFSFPFQPCEANEIMDDAGNTWSHYSWFFEFSFWVILRTNDFCAAQDWGGFSRFFSTLL